MAGITPFLFTSERELAETGRWFEMYINPEAIGLSTKIIQVKTHTKRAIVTTHWRNDHQDMRASGKSGWILKPSILQQSIQDGIHDILHPNASATSNLSLKDYAKKFPDQITQDINNITSKNPNIGKLNLLNTKPLNLTITPRDFVNNLKQIALEDMFYIDQNQIEHYNSKKIQIYTKTFPLGVTLNGYFTDFNIPEKADDSQVISYDFSFVTESSDDSSQNTNFLNNAVRELVIRNDLRI